ncbi:hypothetical protein HKX48_008809 [Thoreauomyces humboldtii]|nr:hypothetical protein HKX48_008809 [Thoreauomyces humboldtii]
MHPNNSEIPSASVGASHRKQPRPPPDPSAPNPMILTLRLDAKSQQHFESMRQKHFPPERNFIPAHLTLFHNIPHTPETLAALSAAAANSSPSTSPFRLQVSGLRSLGKGVAYTIVSPTVLALHRHLSNLFADHLTAQDRQKFGPHVVIQNKVQPEVARKLLEELKDGFEPFEVQAVGLDLWHYMGGPWKFEKTFPFAGQEAAAATCS